MSKISSAPNSSSNTDIFSYPLIGSPFVSRGAAARQPFAVLVGRFPKVHTQNDLIAKCVNVKMGVRPRQLSNGANKL